MDELGGSQLAGVWQVVFDLDELNREVRRLVKDLQRLQGSERTRSLVALATDLEVAASDLRRSVSGPADRPKVGSYMTLIRQRSQETAEEMSELAVSLPSAQKLIDSRYTNLRASMGALPEDLFLDRPPSQRHVAEHEFAQTTIQIGTEIHEIRIRALLAKRNAVLIVDGDRAASEGWADLSVLARRDALLALLGMLRDRASISVMFDSTIGGREAIAPSDGVQVLLTSSRAVLSNALLALVATQRPDSSLMLVTDDRRLAKSAAKLHGDLSTASTLALLRLLVDV
jgi:hypothetical protein